MSGEFDRSTSRRKARDLFDGLAGRRSATDVAFELKEICGLHRTAVGASERSGKALRRLGGVVREFAAQVPRLESAGLAERLGRELADTLAVAFRRTAPGRDSDLRMQLLADMWSLVEVELERGRSEFPSHLRGTFCHDTTAGERDEVVGWFRERLEAAESGDPGSEARRLVGHWMLEYVGEELDDDEFDAVCRETGQNVRLVRRALDAGHDDDAVDWVREAPEGHIADLCRVFHDRDRLGRLVEADALPHPERASISGGATRDVAVMLLEAEASCRAIRWMRRALRIMPLETTLQELRETAEAAGVYGADVERALFEKPREWAPEVTFEVRLEFGELGRALEVWEEDDEQWHADDHRRAGDRLLEAAESRGSGEIAVAVGTAQADILIERRGRDRYADACEYLARARRLVEAAEMPLEWEMLLEEYRERLDGLPAFRDEAEAAGLLS